ncbi:Plant specific Rop nucleotide exchanger, PRONE [Artemisia annua]|uniref:Plant specific Rop nucleotide exchanger, PRONE n=1 Tax=Artemisia annua TaxID=35608 RepID=A0A2U1L0F1_ARTAN|nr:Plant specific Rop nucleotide exchanger, PRONE [Artemisia annua]
MSGGGKGVSSACTRAYVFGEISRLEPMTPNSKARWLKEIDWLLSVTDHIVEFVPSKQNTNAYVFGEISRLEPMTPNSKARWLKEIDWLLSVTDHIVEFVPSKQNTNGVTMEIMVTRR